MPSKFILSFLRVSVTILFYLVIIVTVVFLIASLLNISGKSDHAKKLTNKTYTYEVKGFSKKSKDVPFTYSEDRLVRYQPVKEQYTLQIEPNSAIGYYTLIMKLIFMGLGISVLWNFMKIFRETRLDNPFKHSITKRLKILAALFIISDVLKFIDYLLFNSFLRQSIASPNFELITDVGDGIISGMIIWIIAVIFQRGIALQEENALTV